MVGHWLVRKWNTYSEWYAFHAANGETPVASITGTTQYLMAVHVVCRLNYGHDRLSGSDTTNASAFARPNVTSSSHREQYRPSARPFKRVEKRVTTAVPERQKSQKVKLITIIVIILQLTYTDRYTVLYTRPLINIR